MNNLNYLGKNAKLIKISFAIYLFAILLFNGKISYAKTFYLDGNVISNCISNNYSISGRNCSGADGNAYKTLQDAISNLSGGDTLYVRNGTYIRTTNDIKVGALSVSAAGTAGQRTTVRAYPAEQPVICTAVGKCQYNPNPSDPDWQTTASLSSRYYPNPAISIGANYVDVIGFKTFGQVYIGGNYISIQDSDLGGGGPHYGQGMVVYLDNAHDILVKNNKIHHSCRGDAPVGAGVSGYKMGNIVIENNEFYDNYGEDISVKDTLDQQGKTFTVRYNVFKPSAIHSTTIGFVGVLQYADIDYIYIYNNIFYKKRIAMLWRDNARLSTIAYNNTFVDCTYDIYQWSQGGIINAYNNLHYHSVDQAWFIYLESGSYPLSSLNSNYSLYYSATGNTRWLHAGTTKTSLAEWKSYSGKDSMSVAKNPVFVNAGGNQPSDFKRTNYSGDVSGSQYGAVCGAYETGNEVIGLTGRRPVPPPNPAAQ